jgi:hypothetical protein
MSSHYSPDKIQIFPIASKVYLTELPASPPHVSSLSLSLQYFSLSAHLDVLQTHQAFSCLTALTFICSSLCLENTTGLGLHAVDSVFLFNVTSFETASLTTHSSPNSAV